MRTSSLLLPLLVLSFGAPLSGCGGDEFSSSDAAGGAGQPQGGAGSGGVVAGAGQGGAGAAQGGAGQAQGGAGAAQGGAGQNQGGAGAAQGGAGAEQGGAGAAQGGAGAGQGGAGAAQGGAGSGQGGAGAEQGGAGSGQGGAGSGQGGAGSGQGGAGQSQDGAGMGGGPACVVASDCVGDVANGTQTCEAGVCVAQCVAGFVNVGGLCRDFGGAFVTSEGNCQSKNPLTGDCSCPDGLSQFQYPSWPYDKDVYGTLTLCGPGKPVGQFGGAFLSHMLGSNNCDQINPYNNDCGCKSGADLDVVDVLNQQSAIQQQQFQVCLNPGIGDLVPTIQGVFEKFSDPDIVSGFNAENCLNSYGGATACVCPAGTIENSFHGLLFGNKKGSADLPKRYLTDIAFCLSK